MKPMHDVLNYMSKTTTLKEEKKKSITPLEPKDQPPIKKTLNTSRETALGGSFFFLKEAKAK
jgi:hypothetical protein